MYKCFLMLRSAVRATLAGYASESSGLAGVGPSQSVTSLFTLASRWRGSASGIQPSNPMPDSGHTRPGMVWLLWYQIGVRTQRTRMWFLFQVNMHNHAKRMKSVISLFQRYQQHKCVNTCIKYIKRTSNQLSSRHLSKWKAEPLATVVVAKDTIVIRWPVV